MAININGILTALSRIKGSNKISDSPSRTESDPEQHQVTSQSILDSLSKYTVRKNGTYSKSNDACGVCQSRYTIGDCVVCLPCQHNFHEYCIENWLKWVKATCPIDRKSIIRTECLKEIENERYRMKIQKLLLKDKITNILPKTIPLKNETTEETTDKPVPLTLPAENDNQIPSPLGHAVIKGKEVRLVTSSSLHRHLPKSNKCKDSRMEEALKSPNHSSTPCPEARKRNPALRSRITPKTASDAENSPHKFNYLDFLKSLEPPSSKQVLVSSLKGHSAEEGMFSSKFKQKCTTTDKRNNLDCEGPKLFQKMVSRKCLTSAGLKYSKERKGGWVYKNDIKLPLRGNSFCRRLKTA